MQMRSGDVGSILEERFDTFNEFLLHCTLSLAAFPARRGKDEKKNLHTVTVGEVLVGNQSPISH